MTDYKKYLTYDFLKSLLSKDKLKHYFHKVISLKTTSSSIALSIALGVFVGFFMPIGLQTVVVVPLALFFQCNIILAAGATLVSNPVTVLPIYYVAIQIGNFLTGIDISWDYIRDIVLNPSMERFLTVGAEGAAVFFTGSFVLGIVFAIPVYLLSDKIICYYRHRRELKCHAGE